MIRVVAAAITRDDRVLAAHRSRPPLGWEFPGGKVEDGESDAAALAREISEELGVAITIGRLLGDAADDRVRILLYDARLVDGEPAPLQDHDQLRWLRPDELDAVGWLPIDRELLAHLPRGTA